MAYRSPLSQIRVTSEPVRPCSRMSEAMHSTPMKFVPVEPPTRRNRRSDSTCAAAIEASSGTRIISSMTVGMKEGSTRGRPIPSMREPVAVTSMSPLCQAS